MGSGFKHASDFSFVRDFIDDAAPIRIVRNIDVPIPDRHIIEVRQVFGIIPDQDCIEEIHHYHRDPGQRNDQCDFCLLFFEKFLHENPLL